MPNINKVAWSGRLKAVQPRIRLIRSFDQRQHSYQGYILRIEGICGQETKEYLVAVGKVAHEKYRFRAGMEISGESLPIDDPRLEIAAFYKTSALQIVKEAEDTALTGPPFLGIPPDLQTYRAQGHRRLDVRTYETKCTTCIWGCRMPVEMIIDHWNPSQKEYRFETFCYGPQDCASYQAGPARQVPGRKGMSFTDED